MKDVKQMVFSALAALDIPIQDNPVKLSHRDAPYAIIRTIGAPQTKYKNYYKMSWLLRVDVFSKYKGEKEILDYYSQVLDKLDTLRQEEGITYIFPTISIMDDKELGPITKHGVISITVDTQEGVAQE